MFAFLGQVSDCGHSKATGKRDTGGAFEGSQSSQRRDLEAFGTSNSVNWYLNGATAIHVEGIRYRNVERKNPPDGHTIQCRFSTQDLHNFHGRSVRREV